MSISKRKILNYGLIDDEPPADKLVSEGDLLIKKLVEKQRCTTVSLDEQLNNPKAFIKSSEVTPLSCYTSGTSSLSDVIASTQYFDSIERLKAAGLNEQDAELYLDYLKGFQYVCGKHKNWEKVLLKEHLEVIQRQVDTYQRSSNVSSKQHESKFKDVEHGLTIKPDSVKTKLLKFALRNNTQTQSTVPQAIDNIVQIEQNLFNQLNEKPLPTLNVIRRKARKLRKRLDNLERETQQGISNKTVTMRSNSGWDVVQKKNDTIPLHKTIEKKAYTCLPINYYTIKNNEIVKLDNCKEKAQSTTKLSLDEIKRLPKFKDYQPGNPSSVLYLKNLNNNVREEDLETMFKKYDPSIIECKIMYGKLRGQAFVTFSSEIAACQALEELNGSIIKHKPVIIQFGLKK